MAPSAITVLRQHENVVPAANGNGLKLSNGNTHFINGSTPAKGFKCTEFLFDRNLHKAFPVVKGADGNFLHLADGRRIFDATSGAAVSCLGHNNKRVINAISDELHKGTGYLASVFWSSEVVDELCKELINGTGKKMGRVYLTGSGVFFRFDSRLAENISS